MRFRNDNEDEDDDIEEDDGTTREEDRTARQKRIKNKHRDARKPWEEKSLKEPRKNRPRIKVISWDPDADEDDYEDFYED